MKKLFIAMMILALIGALALASIPLALGWRRTAGEASAPHLRARYTEDVPRPPGREPGRCIGGNGSPPVGSGDARSRVS